MFDVGNNVRLDALSARDVHLSSCLGVLLHALILCISMNFWALSC